jgi:hypothetical protein
MNYDQITEEIKDLLAKGRQDLVKAVLMEVYAQGLKDGKEIREWK